MSTSAQFVDPNSPYLTRVPLRSYAPPTPKTLYERRLVHHNLHKAAERAATNRVFAKLYNASKERRNLSDTWRAPLYTTMLRSEPYHAKQLAKQQNQQFSALYEYSRSQFTRFDIVALLSFDVPDDYYATRTDILEIRERLNDLKHKCVDKLGVAQSSFFPLLMPVKVKVLLAGRMDEREREALDRALPPDWTIENWHVFDKEDFSLELKTFSAPDLPLDAERRADFELLLKGIQQYRIHGVSKEDIHKFAISTKDNANCTPEEPSEEDNPEIYDPPLAAELGKIRLAHVPVSPKTGKPARFVSGIVDSSVQPEDLDELEWLEIIPPD